MSARRRLRTRPLWRTILDGLAVTGTLLLALTLMELMPGGNIAGNMRVVDGDSLRPMDNDGHDIRLDGIDAPELTQHCNDANGSSYRCGQQAKAHLEALIAGRDVTCRTMDVDRYQRSVSVCEAADINLNREMVTDGWAISYRTGEFADEERIAKSGRKGIWQGSFERPQDWRRLNRSAASGRAPEAD